MSHQLLNLLRTFTPTFLAAFTLVCAAVRGEASDVPASTGRVFTRAQMTTKAPGAILGEVAYAEVNSAWLAKWYPTFKNKLFKIGIVKWDSRFDCNRFASFYTDLAQAWFANEMFRSPSPAQALALGTFWYNRANGQGKHAIIQAVTERGRVFIEPQSGEELHLTPAEVSSGYVQMI